MEAAVGDGRQAPAQPAPLILESQIRQSPLADRWPTDTLADPWPIVYAPAGALTDQPA